MNIGEDATSTGRIWAKFGKDPIDHGGIPFAMTPEKWTKQSQSGRNKPHAAAYPVQIWDSAAQAVAMPWYTAGLYAGFMTGARASGEYEYYMSVTYHQKDDPKLPMVPTNTGFGQRTLDSMNLAQSFTWAMMLVSNIAFFMERRAKRGVR
jgi:hypothetical protein